jgi:ribosome biogenesis SPOUT family RNA methylase Rps3
MSPAYERFERGEWRDGFEDACQVLESEARRYLQAGVQSGRIVVLTARGAQKRLTPEKIERLTMGQLKDTLGAIQNKNRADVTIFVALDRLNRDRIGAVHHRRQRRTELRLRQNVGHHMWTIDTALRALFNVPSQSADI